MTPTTINELRTNKSNTTLKDPSGLTYFLQGMTCFLFLIYDAIQHIIDQVIYGNLIKDLHFFDWPWYALITHWTFVIIVWGTCLYLMSRWVKKYKTLKILDFKLTSSAKYLIPIALVLGIVFAFIEYLMAPSILPQIYNEYLHFVEDHGSKALLVSIVQNIYYIFEAGLVVFLVAFMQNAGEKWFKSTKIPFGSIGLATTWGLAHLTHGGLATLWIITFAFAAGLFFQVTKKSIIISYILILSIFII